MSCLRLKPFIRVERARPGKTFQVNPPTLTEDNLFPAQPSGLQFFTTVFRAQTDPALRVHNPVPRHTAGLRSVQRPQRMPDLPRCQPCPTGKLAVSGDLTLRNLLDQLVKTGVIHARKFNR